MENFEKPKPKKETGPKDYEYDIPTPRIEERIPEQEKDITPTPHQPDIEIDINNIDGFLDEQEKKDSPSRRRPGQY